MKFSKLHNIKFHNLWWMLLSRKKDSPSNVSFFNFIGPLRPSNHHKCCVCYSSTIKLSFSMYLMNNNKTLIYQYVYFNLPPKMVFFPELKLVSPCWKFTVLLQEVVKDNMDDIYHSKSLCVALAPCTTMHSLYSSHDCV